MLMLLDKTGKSNGPSEFRVIDNLLRNLGCSRSKFVMISGMSLLCVAERLFAFCHFCINGSPECPTSMSQDRHWRTRTCCLCSTLLRNPLRSTINHRCKGVCISRRR
jgi:hypothetical protein